MSLRVRARRALKGFSLDVRLSADAGILGILGASGSGKSMTLRCIAGIDQPDAGRIELSGRALLDSERGIFLRPQARRVGYLFQNYALFPNMTVEENICCAFSGKRKCERAARLIERFQLGGLSKRYPGQLSGGQQQRVALARCLAADPDALLLDEPFSALDMELREQMQMELLDMLRDYSRPVMLVTHDRQEAYRLCGRLAVMDGGRCIAQGATQALFHDPGLVRVARLTGCRNISPARKMGERRVLATDWGVELNTLARVPEDVSAVGIREDALMGSTDERGENLFRAHVAEHLVNIDFIRVRIRPETSRSGFLWSRLNMGEGIPPMFRVAPEDVLILKGEV